MRRPTQVDVAKLAGVSRSTVSFVINGHFDSKVSISPETVERVMQAVQELGYAPDAGAQALRTPEQTVLFLREVLQGKPTAKLARELKLSRTTAWAIRLQLQANAEAEQTTEPLSDLDAETDEMFQNAEEKR